MARFLSFKNCGEEEEKVAKATLRKFKREFRLFERCLDLFMETIDCVMESPEKQLLDSEGKVATIIILPRIVQSMLSFRVLMTRGYYYDSKIIGRSLLESIGLCLYLSANEEEAIRWLNGKRIRLASIHLFDFARWLNVDVPRKKTYKAAWGKLSNYVHTDIKGAVGLFDRLGKKSARGVMAGKVVLQLAPRFDESEVKGIADIPLLATLMMEEIFQKELKPYKERQIASDRLEDMREHIISF